VQALGGDEAGAGAPFFVGEVPVDGAGEGTWWWVVSCRFVLVLGRVEGIVVARSLGREVGD